MARNAGTQSRNRSSSLSAAWSFFWKSKGSSNHSSSNGSGSNGVTAAGGSGGSSGLSNGSKDNGVSESTATNGGHRHPSTIHEEEDEEDRALVKGVTRKVLPQRRATTVGMGGSGTTTRLDVQHQHQQQQQHQQTLSTQPSKESSTHLSPSSSSSSSVYAPRTPRQRASLDQHRSSSISASWVASYAPSYPSTVLSYPILEGIAVKGEIKNVDTSHMVGTPHHHEGVTTDSPPSTLQDGITAKNADYLLSPGLQSSQQIIQLHTSSSVQEPSYFDISPTVVSPSSSSSVSRAAAPPYYGSRHGHPSSRHSIVPAPSSMISRRSDTHSQSSALTGFIDEKDTELDENSFFVHLRRMQERAAAQHEPGWLRTQHAILQAKHRIPLGSFSSSHTDYTRDSHGGANGGGSGSRRTSLIPGSASSSATSFSQPFLSMFQSSNEQQQQHNHYQQQHQSHDSSNLFSHSHSSKLGKLQQPVLPFNCFQPNHVICVPRERSLGGLIFHKSFIDTHVLTPSPYFQGQFLTLDGKAVEIDRDVVRTISGFGHPRVIQILSEETVYDSNSSRPTRILILERPLEGDGKILAPPGLDARVLRDFNSLCLEFEKTYVYIRGFASYALEKLRLIYNKTRRDCLEDSVKLQRLVKQGSQADQDAFSELIENIVLGKLYHKIYHQSLIPIYEFKDEEVDPIIAAYHQYFFSPGVHRGLLGGLSLAASESKHLQQTLRKLGLSEELQTLKIEQALEPAAVVMRCWDASTETGASSGATNGNGYSSGRRIISKARVANPLDQDAEDAESIKQAYQQERMEREKAKRQSPFSPHSSRDSPRRNTTGTFQDGRSSIDGSVTAASHRSSSSEREQDGRRSILTPLEKACSLKQMLDLIALGAEDHLLDRCGFGFARKKRSDVSVTTDDLIPLLTLAVILARPVNLSTNIFYIQRFRINNPRPEWSFSLVTLEACVEFLKTDPLEILGHRTNSMTMNSTSTNASQHLDHTSSSSLFNGGPQEWPAFVPWGEPSETGWGFSPPKCSNGSLPPTPAAADIPDPHSMLPTSMDTIARRPAASSGAKDDATGLLPLDQQSRHSRSFSMNFEDRSNGGRQEVGEGSGGSSGQGSPFLRGVRLNSGSGSVNSNSGHPRANSLRSTLPQSYHNRITVDQGKDLYSGPTIVPLQPSSSMTMGGGCSHLVVKPQILLPPPPKTPPVGSQKTQPSRVRSRPMSMIAPSSSPSPLAHSYSSSPASGVGQSLLHMRQNSQTSSSGQSSPATSPKLGPPRFSNGNISSNGGSGTSSGISGRRSVSNTVVAPFPVLRANSMTNAMAIQATVAAAEVAASMAAAATTGGASPWQEQQEQQQQQQGTEDSPSPSHASLPSPPSSSTGTGIAARTGHRSSPSGGGSGHRLSVKTSPSRTTTSISTPSTPTIFTPASSPVLRAALTGGGMTTTTTTNGIMSTLQQHIQQTASTPSPPRKSTEEGSRGGVLDTQEGNSLSPASSDGKVNGEEQHQEHPPSSPSSPSSSKRSPERSAPGRLTLSLISPPASQPSTAFFKENVIAAGLSSPTEAGATVTGGGSVLAPPAALMLTTPTGTTSTADLSPLFMGVDSDGLHSPKPSKLTDSASLSQLVLPSAPSSTSSVSSSPVIGHGVSSSGWDSLRVRKTVSSPASPTIEYEDRFMSLDAATASPSLASSNNYPFSPSASVTSSPAPGTPSPPEQKLDDTPNFSCATGNNDISAISNNRDLPPTVLTQSPEAVHATLAASALPESMAVQFSSSSPPSPSSPSPSSPSSPSAQESLAPGSTLTAAVAGIAVASPSTTPITTAIARPASAGPPRSSRELGRPWPIPGSSSVSNVSSSSSSSQAQARSKGLTLDESRFLTGTPLAPSHIHSAKIGGATGSGRRQAAPEIIPLPSPLLGDIVHRKGGSGEVIGSHGGSGSGSGSFVGSMSSSPGWAAMTHAMRRDSGSGGAGYPSRRSFESPLMSAHSVSASSSLQHLPQHHHYHQQQHHHHHHHSTGHLPWNASTATTASGGGLETSSFGSQSFHDRRSYATHQPPQHGSSRLQHPVPVGSGGIHPFALPDQDQSSGG
ncbi:hypothetical protein BGZ73_006032, partial [Actinomortierella ambigua]